MPINPSQLLYGQVSEADFKEFVHGTTSIRTDAFSVNAADLTMNLQIPGDKLKPALQWILGVSYMDQSSVLRRSLPMFHPVHPWAWAKSVKVNGQQYNGDDNAAVVWEYQSTPAAWKKYDVQVTFEMPDYHLRGEESRGIDWTLEYQRFVSKQLTPRVELVSINDGRMKYSANATDLWNDKPHVGEVPVARRDFAGVKLVWHQVPLEYVQADDDSLPTKLLQVQGKVNSATFLGQVAETLLCSEVRLNKYVSPLLTDTIGELYFMYDIEIDLIWTSQLDADIGKAGETRRGHNMLLGPKTQYWYVRDPEHANARSVYIGVDFAKIFTIYTDGF